MPTRLTKKLKSKFQPKFNSIAKIFKGIHKKGYLTTPQNLKIFTPS